MTDARDIAVKHTREDVQTRKHQRHIKEEQNGQNGLPSSRFIYNPTTGRQKNRLFSGVISHIQSCTLAFRLETDDPRALFFRSGGLLFRMSYLRTISVMTLYAQVPTAFIACELVLR